MKKLIEGHKYFLRSVFPLKRDSFHRLAETQAPDWLFITCSDSRLVPDLFLQTDPGDLFIIRNAGNVIPMDVEFDGVTATIEYAVEVLKVRHAIVCGHSDCGAVKAALDREKLVRLPKANQWLHHVEEAFAYGAKHLESTDDEAGLTSFIHANVIAQLENLRSQPAVARALAEGRLSVHGWFYDILTGEIEEYVRSERRFRRLEDLSD
jgi:carbonic anhydrase